ncbi:GlsB/YeaQ/YmgE family stress response membrane protein [candidate division WWE3 bacterium CG_4_10_14_0_2_um_filter_42_7]|uniref:GlsB/YeaQ/YmgE family stress response membrane protein n=2 Tax=Katanobacteria TaxID=422282 RepID=A0A2H0XB08_UNCKA|nr:MAG: GlsB/YeaQ/YmgE family stress response membrane protein [candidate division WWE3 bacterium CG08_land_8_20_14_0_20_41_15]PIZ43544.1 MAG: GlsB/YeaQ/YmgE family stress response membrane protein [candidate division WWE3 bacterium CG_4_10_14_0_2_um_filter_42_7]
MTILYWIVFGLIAGSIANFIAPSSQGGILGSIILGIIGAVVGGYLGQRFFDVGVTGFNLTSFMVAVAGSLLVLFIGRLLMRS